MKPQPSSKTYVHFVGLVLSSISFGTSLWVVFTAIDRTLIDSVRGSISDTFPPKKVDCLKQKWQLWPPYSPLFSPLTLCRYESIKCILSLRALSHKTSKSLSTHCPKQTLPSLRQRDKNTTLSSKALEQQLKRFAVVGHFVLYMYFNGKWKKLTSHRKDRAVSQWYTQFATNYLW